MTESDRLPLNRVHLAAPVLVHLPLELRLARLRRGGLRGAYAGQLVRAVASEPVAGDLRMTTHFRLLS